MNIVLTILGLDIYGADRFYRTSCLEMLRKWSVRKQKNLKTGARSKQSTSNFPENEHFLPPDTHMHTPDTHTTLTFQKNLFYLLQWKPFKSYEKCFLFHLESSFFPKISKFFYWLFGHAEKATWLERKCLFQNLWHHNMVNKQWQNTFCSISHEIKGKRMKQKNEIWSINRI